jgi:hypothetical protein
MHWFIRRSHAALLLAALTLLVSGACSGDDADDTPRTTETSAPAATAMSTPAPSVTARSEPPGSPEPTAPIEPSTTTVASPSSNSPTPDTSPVTGETPTISGGIPTVPPVEPAGDTYVAIDSWNLGILGLGGIASGPDGGPYVIDYGTDRAIGFTPAGEPVAIYDFASDLQMGSQQNDIAVAPSGDVYILDQEMNRVLVFAPDGSLIAEWGGEISFEPGSAFDARAIAVDADGNIYLADPTPRLQVFSRDGELLDVWNRIGDELFPQTVQDMEIVGDRLYVLGEFRGGVTIVTLTLDGALADEPVMFIPGQAETDLLPSSIGVGSDGAIFAADPFQQAIVRVGPDGTVQARWPLDSAQSGEGIELAAGPDGRVYVGRNHTGTLTVFAPSEDATDQPSNTPTSTADAAAIVVTPASGSCDVSPTVSGTGFESGALVDVYLSLGSSNFLVIASDVTVAGDGSLTTSVALFEHLDCGSRELTLGIHAITQPRTDADPAVAQLASTTYTLTP